MPYKRYSLGLAALVITAITALGSPGIAANIGANPGISQKVAPCDWSYPTRCQKVNADGSVNVSGTITTSLGAFNPVASTSLAVSNVSARVAFPSGDASVLIRNTSTADAYLVFGTGSVVATTGTGTLLPAGQAVAYAVGASTNVAAITASGTTSLAITTGSGLPALTGGGGGSGGGGAITAASGSIASGAYSSGSVASGAFALGSIVDLGTGASPGTNTTNGYLKSLSTNLPAFAATPTFNLGTLNGAATAANQSTEITSLGTIATNSGTQATAANQTSVIGTKAAGTAAASSVLVGGVYNSSAPTLTTGQQAAMQFDSSGNLKINVVAGGAGGGAITAASSSYAAGAFSVGAGSDGWDVAFGSKADAATCATTNTAMACFRQLHADVTGAIPAGTNLIGHVIADTGSTTAVTSLPALPAGTNTLGATYSFQNSTGNTLPAAADASVAINVSTATTTQLVALSSGKKIYVAAYDVIAGGTGNITFEYGTGSNCGTGTTVLTGAYNLTAQAGISKGNGLGAVLVVPASNALCVLTSAAVQMSGSVAYSQF